jgi:hypothetical protein
VPNDATQLAAYQGAIDMLTDVDSYSGLMVSKRSGPGSAVRYGAITAARRRGRRASSAKTSAISSPRTRPASRRSPAASIATTSR